ncbi:MAG: thioredoxin domain-containing protein, partial [Gammaproteobacteria bacterium]
MGFLKIGFASLLLGLAVAAHAGHLSTNGVDGHGSPYLAMHGKDPVHWQPWGADALAQARNEDKLLYVTVGYFSCYWCHVMHRQSFRNAEIASMLNEGFVSVVIDRELRPALDAHLMDFVERTRGRAGWPLNVFITPEGHPLVGTTYMRPDTFKALLARLDGRWQEQKGVLKSIAEEAARVLASQRPSTEARELGDDAPRRYRRKFLQQTMSVADELAGGFGEDSKFPLVPQLRALLAEYQVAPTERLGNFLHLTFRQMALKGLRDQLGGGFFRYTTDPGWEQPHFEKMLYDNALLADLYLQAGEVLGDPQLRAIGSDTLDFMLADLAGDSGAFIASLSSVDDKGVEGGHYLWDEATLEDVLQGRELDLARMAWGLEGTTDFDHGYLPMQSAGTAQLADRLSMEPTEVGQTMAAVREKMLAARKQRALPQDIKQLAAWNGLALSALARAAAQPQGQHYRRAGRKLHQYLTETLWDGGELIRARDHNGAVTPATLEDYAFVAQGLLAWARLTGNEKHLAPVKRLVHAAWARFRTNSGWTLSGDSLIPFARAEPALADGA